MQSNRIAGSSLISSQKPLERQRTIIVAPSTEGRARIYELERHRGFLEVLVLLSQNGRVSKRQIQSNIKAGREAMDRCLETLEVLGLARLHSSASFPFSKLYFLTDRGQLLVSSPISVWPAILEQI